MVDEASNVPWLDNSTKVKLGLANPDIKIRQGRHHLRHILNASKSIIVVDTSLDEASSPSPPLAEWLEEVAENTAIFSEVPDIVSKAEYDEDNERRSWNLLEHDTNKALKLRIFSTKYDGEMPTSTKSGNQGRDVRQRSGLALQSGRQPELLPNNNSALAVAYELPINNRIINSQSSMNSIEAGHSMSWQERENMVSYASINLRPGATSANSNTRATPKWPNLGHRINAS